MNVSVHDTAHGVVISLAGDLDMSIEEELIDVMVRTVERPNITSMRVDATKVDFIDSSGLRALIAGLQGAVDHGIAFTLEVAPDGRVEKLLALTGLDQHFNVEYSD